MNYMTNVSFYFVLKASGVADIKSHPVIDALVELRSTLEKTEQAEEELQPEIEDLFLRLDAPANSTKKATAVTKTQIPEKKKKSIKEKSAPKAVEQEPEFSASDLDGELEQGDIQESSDEGEKEETSVFDVEQEFKSLKKANKKRKRSAVDDFGELDALDELDMEDKIAKKRSLRDYVAKIDAVSDKSSLRVLIDSSDMP